MKTSKASAAFLTKFSSFLSKFKQSSTISVAHDQIRKLFSQYKFSQIAISFASKMDSCDQLNEKQKRQYIKIYISLIDVYGQDIVLEYYDRIVDSIAKKGIGVAEVVGHLCRTLLNRIYPKENIANYIRHLLVVFQRHGEIGKIVKQIVESFEPQIIAPFQSEVANLITEKMAQSQKGQTKVQLLQATLAMVLALESKFYEQATIQPFVQKNFKSDDWNARKLCVDIAYALMVINQSAIRVLHDGVLELRYDKIKHVRDAVGNYTNLYKQIYGEQKEEKKEKERPSLVGATIKSQQDFTKRTVASRSPAVASKFTTKIQPEMKKSSNSLQKSIKNTTRNEGFFQNAGNKDVIKVSQSKSLVFNKESLPQPQKRKQSPRVSHNYILQKQSPVASKKSPKKIPPETTVNFQQYLKNRPHQESYFNFSPTHDRSSQPPQKIQTSYNPMQNLHPKPHIKQYSLELNLIAPDNNDNSQIVHSKLVEQNYIEESTAEILRKQIKGINGKLDKFIGDVLGKLNNLEKRVVSLEDGRRRGSDIQEISLSSLQKDIKDMKHQISVGYLEESFQNRFNQISKQKNFTKKQQPIFHKPHNPQPFQSPIESNLSQKLQQSIQQNNWDQAFSLAIANNSKNSLFQLLKYEQIPQDKLVQDCLLVELRRNLGNLGVLKWLGCFVREVEMGAERVKKLVNDLERAQYKYEEGDGESDRRNYQMLKSILMNQIRSKHDTK